MNWFNSFGCICDFMLGNIFIYLYILLSVCCSLLGACTICFFFFLSSPRRSISIITCVLRGKSCIQCYMGNFLVQRACRGRVAFYFSGAACVPRESCLIFLFVAACVPRGSCLLFFWCSMCAAGTTAPYLFLVTYLDGAGGGLKGRLVKRISPGLLLCLLLLEDLCGSRSVSFFVCCWRI